MRNQYIELIPADPSLEEQVVEYYERNRKKRIERRKDLIAAISERYRNHRKSSV